jgi:UDP-2,3-diacylglucosamine pyrophosphatase LpxH
LPHWSPADQAVIDHLNRRVREGAVLHYIRGNHDPAPHRAPAHARLNATVLPALIHAAGDGRRYLVLHGDEADSRFVRSHLATRFGSLIDHLLRRFDQGLRRLRIGAGGEARSLIEGVISSLNALSYAGRAHERTLIAMAREAGLDGVICGHFHIAGLHEDHGLIYANCGDWVDSFTALEEGHDGTLRLFGGRSAFETALPNLESVLEA